MNNPTLLAVDGLFGIDRLGKFDIDFDMPKGRITLYQQQSCVTAGPNWPKRYEIIEGGGLPGSHLHFPVHLDRRKITALIDTGAQRTTLTAKAAAGLGVTDGMLSRDRSITVRGAVAEQINSRFHQILSVGNWQSGYQ